MQDTSDTCRHGGAHAKERQTKRPANDEIAILLFRHFCAGDDDAEEHDDNCKNAHTSHVIT